MELGLPNGLNFLDIHAMILTHNPHQTTGPQVQPKHAMRHNGQQRHGESLSQALVSSQVLQASQLAPFTLSLHVPSTRTTTAAGRPLPGG